MAGSVGGADKRVVLGRIGKAHGIKGWLRVNSYTSPPENLLRYSGLMAGQGNQWQPLEIDEFSHQADRLLVHVTGVDDPEQAQQLTGKELAVNSSQLPGLEEGAYYWHQLEGLEVWNSHGQLFGQVARLLETGGNDVLVVAPTDASIDARERLIPYLEGTVISEVDLEQGRIRVDWEADYLA